MWDRFAAHLLYVFFSWLLCNRLFKIDVLQMCLTSIQQKRQISPGLCCSTSLNILVSMLGYIWLLFQFIILQGTLVHRSHFAKFVVSFEWEMILLLPKESGRSQSQMVISIRLQTEVWSCFQVFPCWWCRWNLWTPVHVLVTGVL